MLTSELKSRIKSYLGYKGEFSAADETDELISSCFDRLLPECAFRYEFAKYDKSAAPSFLAAEPYRGFLAGCNAVALVVTTLGSGADDLIRRLSRLDLTASLVTDACASAYVEYLADGFEERAFGKERTYRFCPGYGGSSAADSEYILRAVRAERMGVYRNDSGYMLPAKSMAGVVGLGKRAEKTCENCFLVERCAFRKEGKRCYSEKK